MPQAQQKPGAELSGRCIAVMPRDVFFLQPQSVGSGNFILGKSSWLYTFPTCKIAHLRCCKSAMDVWGIPFTDLPWMTSFLWAVSSLDQVLVLLYCSTLQRSTAARTSSCIISGSLWKGLMSSYPKQPGGAGPGHLKLESNCHQVPLGKVLKSYNPFGPR